MTKTAPATKSQKKACALFLKLIKDKMKSKIPMKKNSAPHLGKALVALSCIYLFAAASASAVLVTWNLNPNGWDQDAGSTHVTLTQLGYSITAYGYTNSGGTGTPLELYYKNQGFDETGLGIVGPSDHELQSSGSQPSQFITLDLSSL